MFEERGEGGLEWEEARTIVIRKKAGVRSEKKKWYSSLGPIIAINY